MSVDLEDSIIAQKKLRIKTPHDSIEERLVQKSSVLQILKEHTCAQADDKGKGDFHERVQELCNKIKDLPPSKEKFAKVSCDVVTEHFAAWRNNEAVPTLQKSPFQQPWLSSHSTLTSGTCEKRRFMRLEP